MYVRTPTYSTTYLLLVACYFLVGHIISFLCGEACASGRETFTSFPTSLVVPIRFQPTQPVQQVQPFNAPRFQEHSCNNCDGLSGHHYSFSVQLLDLEPTMVPLAKLFAVRANGGRTRLCSLKLRRGVLVQELKQQLLRRRDASLL